MLNKRTLSKSLGHILSKLLRLETRFRGWLDRVRLQLAVSSAYQKFAETHPRWAASLFDEYFLRGQAAPLLARYVQAADPPTPVELARAWFDQFGPLLPASARGNGGEVTEAASDFLQVLRAELCQAGR